jgi:hypothetical protein
MRLDYRLVRFNEKYENTYPDMFSQVLVYGLKGKKAVPCSYGIDGFIDNETRNILRLDWIKYWTYLPKLVEKENE